MGERLPRGDHREAAGGTLAGPRDVWEGNNRPIGLAGGEGEAGVIELRHHMSAPQVEQALNLRGAVLKVTIEEEE